MHQLSIERMTKRRDLTRLDCAKHCASRLGQMVAVIEATLTEMRSEFRKGALKHAFAQVVETEFLETR